MANIITFANQKGGVGKSTATLLVASTLATDHKVLVIDADQQQSIIARRLSDRQLYPDMVEPYEIRAKNFKEVQASIEELDEDFDYILFDVPGRLDSTVPIVEQEITKFLYLSDFIFIPIAPGNFAMESSLKFIQYILKLKNLRAKSDNPLTDAVVFVNMSEQRTLDDRHLLAELEELKTMLNIRFMDTSLNRYALFRNADTFTSLYDTDTSDKAKLNFAEWFDEFKAITNA